LAGGLFTTGCHLGQPASASFASVLISGKTPAQINDTTVAVFKENGYLASLSDQGWTFEKEGTRGQTLAYDGLVSAHYGAVTLVRVRVKVVAAGNDAQRLQCQAYMVTDATDPLMIHEVRLANYRSGPYQKILDEVAKRLSQP
jgi:hypothetical protein